MEPYKLTIDPYADKQIHLGLSQGGRALLRATLPLPSKFWDSHPAQTLVESLADWLDARLHVVLDADVPADGFNPGLIDERGTGCRMLSFEVTRLVRRRHRRRSVRDRGPDSLRNAHQPRGFDRLEGGDR